MRETATDSGRNQLNLDWLFYLALFLWCTARTFAMSLVGFEGLFVWEDSPNFKVMSEMLV